MQLFVVYAQPEQEKLPLSIAMAQVEPIALKVSYLNVWNRAPNMFLVTPGPAISNLLCRAAMLFYLWGRMRWRVLPMAFSATRFLRKPGTTPGLMTRWLAKVGFWQRLRDVGMCQQSSFLVTKRPAARC